MRALKLFASFILLMMILIVGMSAFFSNKLQDFFVDKVNNYFSTDLIIKDNIEFSVIENFPYASLTLNKVELRESIKGSQRNVLEADKLSFLFGLGDVLEDSYSIEKIAIRNGKIDLRNLYEGKSNFDVFTENEVVTDTTSVDFGISLQEAIVDNVTIHYVDEPYEQELTLKVKNGTLSGDFGATFFTMETQADVFFDQAYVGDINYLDNKNATVDLAMGVDFEKERYTFSKNHFSIEENQFEMDGFVDLEAQHTDMDVTIKGVDLNLAETLHLMPDAYKDYLEGTTSRGKLNFSAQTKGKLSKTKQPNITFNFDLKDGRIDNDQIDEPLKKVNLNGVFSNGPTNELSSSSLDLKQFEFELNGKPIRLQALIRNLEEPNVDVRLDGALDLATFTRNAAEQNITKLQGLVDAKSVRIKGRLQDLANPDAFTKAVFEGKLSVKDVACKYNNKWLEKINGQLDMKGKNWNLTKFQVALDKSDINMTGLAKNVAPLLFFQAFGDSTATNKPVLYLNVDASSKLIDVQELMGFMADEENAKESTKKSDFELSIQDFIVGKINLEANKIVSDKVEITNAKGALTFNDREFIIEQVLMDMFGGKVEMRGDFVISEDRSLVVKTFIDCEKLDMHKFLSDFDNFGQEAFTDDNIEGLFSSKAYVKAYFDKRLEMDEDKLLMIADLKLENGELIEFEPMMALAKFVKLSELKRVKFATLENQIEIAKSKMRIPAMSINSNAIRFNLSGIHSFENRILYYVQLNMGDLLFNKFKNKNRDITKDKKGLVNVNVVMSGDAEDPKIEYLKRKKVKDQFDQDANKSKTDLDEILAGEFSVGRGELPEVLFDPITNPFDTLDIFQVEWSDTMIITKD